MIAALALMVVMATGTPEQDEWYVWYCPPMDTEYLEELLAEVEGAYAWLSSGRYVLRFPPATEDFYYYFLNRLPLIGFCGDVSELAISARRSYYDRLRNHILISPTYDRARDVKSTIHELGHSLGWEHSGSCEPSDGRACEYDNPLDFMSGGIKPQTTCENLVSVGWPPDGDRCYWASCAADEAAAVVEAEAAAKVAVWVDYSEAVLRAEQALVDRVATEQLLARHLDPGHRIDWWSLWERYYAEPSEREHETLVVPALAAAVNAREALATARAECAT
ncbi:MAG: hypothetical protein F4Y40_11705 [Acidimicrobiia bacterium]|nr:hypothetical protein [Acidimicrobiia bacterium]MYF84799.1 hypothetical protein [Acidimicrobiia bacterium]